MVGWCPIPCAVMFLTVLVVAKSTGVKTLNSKKILKKNHFREEYICFPHLLRTVANEISCIGIYVT